MEPDAVEGPRNAPKNLRKNILKFINIAIHCAITIAMILIHNCIAPTDKDIPTDVIVNLIKIHAFPAGLAAIGDSCSNHTRNITL